MNELIRVAIKSALVLLASCALPLSAADLKIININTGAAQNSSLKSGNSDETFIGISKFLIQETYKNTPTNEVPPTIIAMQEVDQYLDRSNCIDQAKKYSEDIFVNAAKKYGYANPIAYPYFQPLVDFSNPGNSQCRQKKSAQEKSAYGNTTLSNLKPSKTRSWKFAWDSNNKKNYGKEQRGAIATKYVLSDKVFWLINTHLSVSSPKIAERQIWQILGKIGELDPNAIVILVGDLNIRANGTLNSSNEAKYENEKNEHKNSYLNFSGILKHAGFIELSSHIEYTFKAWRNLSKLDYAFIYVPDSTCETIGAETTQCVANEYSLNITTHAGVVMKDNVYYTDHKPLILDINLNDR